VGDPRPRTRWTDERLDDLALGVRDELRELRAEMREGFREVRADIREVRGEAAINRRWLVNLWATTMLGFVSLLVEISLR
jgi:hypothetical protein